jgi:hypothetical protein
MKEQLFTLAEYYTLLYHLAEMSVEEVRAFLDLSRRTHIVRAIRSCTSLASILHESAHGTVPKLCRTILSEIGTDAFEETRLLKNDFKTPHRYHPLTVLKALNEKFKESKFRRSVPAQLLALANPSFDVSFIRNVIDHLFRETY